MKCRLGQPGLRGVLQKGKGHCHPVTQMISGPTSS
jgi:hypothetical protein